MLNKVNHTYNGDKSRCLMTSMLDRAHLLRSAHRFCSGVHSYRHQNPEWAPVFSSYTGPYIG